MWKSCNMERVQPEKIITWKIQNGSKLKEYNISMKRVPYEKRATRKKYNMAKEQDGQIQQCKTFSIRKLSSGVLQEKSATWK